MILRVALAFIIVFSISAALGKVPNFTFISVMIDPLLQKGKRRETVIVIFLNAWLTTETN